MYPSLGTWRGLSDDVLIKSTQNKVYLVLCTQSTVRLISHYKLQYPIKESREMPLKYDMTAVVCP